MIFTKKRIKQVTFMLQIGQSKIALVNKIKYLGVTMYETLSGKEHANYVSIKSARES